MTVLSKDYKQLCTACGVCAAACPKGALEMNLSSSGIMHPVFRQNTECNNCGLCTRVCGGYKLPEIDVAASCFKQDTAIGPWCKIYQGYATRKAIRAGGASGGIVTAILVHLLQRGDICGAVVTVADPENPFSSKTILATSTAELLASQKSRYTQVDYSKGLKELILAPQGNYAIVGLPCQLASLEKLARHNKKIKEKLALKIGLFCGHGSSSHLGELIALKGLKINPNSVKSVCYRSGSWEKFGFEYQGDFGKKWMQFGGNSMISKFWSTYFLCPERCLLCSDGFAEYSDISCGDAWNIFAGNKELGGSVLITRTEVGQQAVDKVCTEERVSLTEIEIEDLLCTQPSVVRFEKALHPAIIKIFKLLNWNIPLNAPLKSTVTPQYKQLFAAAIIICHSKCSLILSRSAILRYVPVQVLSLLQEIIRKGILYGSKK